MFATEIQRNGKSHGSLLCFRASVAKAFLPKAKTNVFSLPPYSLAIISFI
jgi:hypothetical protein